MKSKILFGILVCAVVLAAYLFSACYPFASQPLTDREQRSSISEFYSQTVGSERAMVISENKDALTERIRLIANAQDSIVLSTFDMQSDNSGKLILAALSDAADRGVKVKLLLDGFSYFTHAWGNPYFLSFAQHENVEMKVYNPVNLLKPWKLMARMHDKYLIVDDSTYILGGRNVYDFFLGEHDGYKNYDWDVLVLAAETSKDTAQHTSLKQLKAYFQEIWNKKECRTIGKSAFFRGNPSVVKAGEELLTLYEEAVQTHKDWFMPVDYNRSTVETNHIRLVANPTHTGVKQPVVYDTLTELMAQPGQKVFFHTPYILCSDWMLERLRWVCSVNSDVTMMTNSVANNGNPFGAADYLAHKGEILATGLQILEYDSGVSYHGKCFTVGDRLSGIGSFNWDMRSAYIDTELMLVIDSRELNAQLRSAMSHYEQTAFRALDENSYQENPGMQMQELSGKRKTRIKLLRFLVEKFRFLM